MNVRIWPLSLTAVSLFTGACGPGDYPVNGTNPLVIGAGNGSSRPDEGEGSGGTTSGGNGTGHGSASGNPADNGEGVDVEIERVHAGAATVSFGVPVASGVLSALQGISVRVGGKAIDATVTELLADYSESGERVGVRAFRVQFDAASLGGAESATVQIRWSGGGAEVGDGKPYSDASVSVRAPAIARTTVRTIGQEGGNYVLKDGPINEVTVFEGRETKWRAKLPPGYLASTGVLGPQSTAATAQSDDFAGLAFLSEALEAFTDASMYREPYAFNPHPESVVDEVRDYSAWLYDRCATYLTAYAHFGEPRFFADAQKACSYYSDKIALTGSGAGTFTGKPDPDPKYSHQRGLYAYYALTGDERARDAAVAIADMWLGDRLFVGPYREGHVLGADKTWTERLLATSLEGLIYGFFITGDTKYLNATKEIVSTAHKHITGDAAALRAINPTASFPPQNCFIHSGLQQVEQDATDPWCSPWMSAMLVDPLLAYQALTGDARVDDIFVRLGRFLRDTGTSYFTNDVLNDSFLEPSVCDGPDGGSNRRRLVPLYGAGIDASGKRATFGDWSDFEHCPDATALSAAALAALKRTGGYGKNPVGPFASEGESFEALHHELAACAKLTFENHTRPARAPDAWSSAALAPGASNPAAFIDQNKIGFPVHVQMPRRKLSWWFNEAMEQYSILDAARIPVREIVTGWVEPASCR